MKLFLVKFWFINGTALFYLFIPNLIVAQQIIQDTTLPENSVITQEGNRIQIDGGTSNGNNLFHSFEKFTVSPNNTAVFNNPINIQNIFSRVTGSTRSNIDGIIQANGTANLFLINPNGIIFGENASLNIGGSFFATTADSIHFTDGTQFSATKPLEQPLLTINTPIGLGFGETPKDIVNKSRASDRSGQFFAGLQVEFGKTLALVGGQVSLEGGFLTAESGRVELGSVGANDFVSLTPNSDGWILGYEESQSFQDISLSEAFINVIGRKSGDIQIQGKSVSLTEGSQILAISFAEGQAGNVEIKASELVKLEGASENIGTITSIFNEVEGEATGNGSGLTIETERLIVKDGAQLSTATFGSGQGVDLRVNASKSIEIEGSSNRVENDQPSGLFARVQPEATGNGGTITLNTGQLIIKDGAQISNDTRGIGSAGDLEISASEFILLEGTNLDNTGISGIFSQVATGASGDAGNLTLETGQLNILDGAQISTSARSGGQGGSLTINASDFILVSGTSPLGDAFSSSNILVSAELGATKDAGSLTIETGELTVEKGAKISADNFGTGKGANVTLNVDKLTLKDGGIIGAGSLLQPIGLVKERNVSNERGSGGTLTVNATESVEVTGTGFIGSTPVKSSLFTRGEGTGDAGDLNINTPLLTIKDGGGITAQASGTGEGGNITFTGEELILNNGFITASTASTQGGNITLNIEDNLQFINSGEITASAGTAEAGGDGGNVEINSNFILAFPTDNTYQITAEAFEGDGGSIAIATNSIFGEEFIDFSVSSQFGLDGEIAINTPDVDPVQGLINLPTEVVDPSQLISQSCLADDRETEGKSSEFIVTGRGGLPPSPNQSLKGNATISPEWVAINSLDTENTLSSRLEAKKESPKAKLPKIVQAVGWVRNANGRLTLVAENPYVSASVVNYPGCQ